MESLPQCEEYTKKARKALLASYLLNEPFVTLFGVFTIIITKYLGASALQIALFTMLKPTVSLFSFYLSMRTRKKPEKLRTHLALATSLSVAPFLFIPFMDSIWFCIFAAACYMLFSRAGVPALIEILKINLPQRPREKLFSLASTTAYGAGVMIGLGIGDVLDTYQNSWKFLFFISSLLVLIGAQFQRSFPMKEHFPLEQPQPTSKEPFVKWLTQPIKETMHLLQERKDFAHFQWGFMIAMIGLMLAMPAIPFFFTSINLSFLELMISFNLCKGLGFILASPFWTKALKHYTIYQLSCSTCIGFGLFYLLMLLTPWNIAWLFSAYVVYGIVQAGSNLLWHLSGPMFSGNDDSASYSSVNILMVGLRGAIVPPLGGLLCEFFGPQTTIFFGMCICFYGGYYLVAKKTYWNKNKTTI